MRLLDQSKKHGMKKRGKADSQLHNLANQELNRNKMKIGDYVIINDGQSDILGSCVIRGDYKYDETKPCPHTRKVEYLSTETKGNSQTRLGHNNI